jgi:hypothetical protein
LDRVRYPNYTARPLCLGIEFWMPQEAPDERSDLNLTDACHSDAVAWVPQARLKACAGSSTHTGAGVLFRVIVKCRAGQQNCL